MISLEQAQKINEIVTKAGEFLGKLAQDPAMRVPQAKGDGSPVTPADEAVSRLLVADLSELGYLVVSEEALPAEPPAGGQTYFLVDPLDGTKYFARGEQEFAVCVGLMMNGEPVYGGIYDPTEHRLFWALKGQGAYCSSKKIQHPGPQGLLRTYSSGFHKRPEKDMIVNSLGIGEISEKGSALKFCDIAMGKIDLYMRFGPTAEWDTAAAQVLLSEADCDLLEAATLKTMTYAKTKYLNRGVIACHKSVTNKVVNFLEQHRDNFSKKPEPYEE